MRLDDINQKENSIKLTLQTVDYRLLKLEELQLETVETLGAIQHYLALQTPPMVSGPVTPSIYWSCITFTGPTNFSFI